MRGLLLLMFLLIAGAATADDGHKKSPKARCSGTSLCRACKNCKYCQHCAKNGGSCGVCTNYEARPVLRKKRSRARH